MLVHLVSEVTDQINLTEIKHLLQIQLRVHREKINIVDK